MRFQYLFLSNGNVQGDFVLYYLGNFRFKDLNIKLYMFLLRQ
jgi:hypothetical protein